MADVICPSCGGRYHETTDAYVPGAITTGNMLTLKKQYVDNGWASFPEFDSTSFGDMDCPECGGLYSDNGRVTIDQAQYAAEFSEIYGTSIQLTKVDDVGNISVDTIPTTEFFISDNTKRKPGRPRR